MINTIQPVRLKEVLDNGNMNAELMNDLVPA